MTQEQQRNKKKEIIHYSTTKHQPWFGGTHMSEKATAHLEWFSLASLKLLQEVTAVEGI